MTRLHLDFQSPLNEIKIVAKKERNKHTYLILMTLKVTKHKKKSHFPYMYHLLIYLSIIFVDIYKHIINHRSDRY